MAINRLLWKNSFRIETLPEWKCPTCQRGNLTGERKDFNIKESSVSLAGHENIDWDANWVSGVFSSILKCNNSKCNESVSVIGTMEVIEEAVYIEKYDDLDYNLFETLTPKLFIPGLKIFDIINTVPEKLIPHIQDAFDIYFTDVSACANKIRIVIELLMDLHKIKKTSIVRGKRKRLTLHKRIEEFKLKYPIEGELLMAIKWIGNYGSHNLESLTKDDILDGFEMLEHVLNNLYETNSKRIKSLGKKINKRRGPLKTR